MLTISALLRSAWIEYRRQPVLNEAVLWLIVLPLFGTSIIGRLSGISGDPYWQGYEAPEEARWPMFGLIILLNVFIIWGTAVVLVSTRDRSKSYTFSDARAAAAPLIGPLFLTIVLRLCLTALWTLVLIVPGVLYSLRTVLAEPIVALEGVSYRPALERSIALIKGRTTHVAWLLVGASLALFFPIGLLLGIIEAIVQAIDPRLLALSDGLQAAMSGVASAVFMLVLVAVYQHLKSHPLEKRT